MIIVLIVRTPARAGENGDGSWYDGNISFYTFIAAARMSISVCAETAFASLWVWFSSSFK